MAFSPERRLQTISNLYKWLASESDSSAYTAWNSSALAKAFGSDVAARASEAFRHYWRSEAALLWSARAPGARNTIEGEWIYSLNGVAAESQTGADWATRLTTEEAKIAAGLATIELVGLPSWLVDLATAQSAEVEEVLGSELSAQLGSAGQEQHLPLLQAVAHAEVRVQSLLASRILKAIDRDWTSAADLASAHLERHLENAFQILERGAIAAEILTELMDRQYQATATTPLGVTWLRGLFKSSPRRALNGLQATLAALKPDQRDGYAIGALAAMFGSYEGFAVGTANEAEQAQILGELARLAYTHVRPADDRQHDGVFTPSTRDQAERARGAIMGSLLETKGYEAQRIIMELAADPVSADIPDRLRMLARDRAAKDAEPPARTAADILVLERRYELPLSDRDGLFNVMTDRLDDLAEDISHHDFTDRRALRLVKDESDMQRSIALRLEGVARGAYVVTRESEVADEKRTDIRLAAVRGGQKGTIEVKIADHWSVSELEQALRDQLVGRYLRHDSSRAGCLLLTHNGTKKYWEHPLTAQRIDFNQVIAHVAGVAETIVRERGHDIRLGVSGLDLRDPVVP